MTTKWKVGPRPEPKVPTGYGRWREAVEAVAELPDGQALLIPRALSASEVSSLRSAARWRHMALTLRTRPEGTYVWRRGECEGFEKYREHLRKGPVAPTPTMPAPISRPAPSLADKARDAARRMKGG